MNKIYIIVVNPEISNLEKFSERVKMLGSNYIFWNTHWLVYSNMSAEEIYKKLATDEFLKLTMFITEINPKNYYGWMDPSLWNWMKNNNQSRKD